MWVSSEVEGAGDNHGATVAVHAKGRTSRVPIGYGCVVVVFAMTEMPSVRNRIWVVRFDDDEGATVGGPCRCTRSAGVRA